MRTQDELLIHWIAPYIERKTGGGIFDNPFSAKVSKYVFFDVGANIGNYVSLVKSQYPEAVVHCFEPNVHVELSNNTAKYTNVCVVPKAVSDFEGYSTIYAPSKAQTLGSLIERPIFAICTDSVILKIEVPVTTIDLYLSATGIKHIDYLKIDVEGQELAALKGAKIALEQKRVNAGQFEYGETFRDTNITLEQTVQFLNEVGYRVFEGPPCKENELKPETLVEDYRWENMLFLNAALL